MVVVGADVHKRTHTFVAVDAVGKRVGEKVVAATSAGHAQALRWARERFGAELIWGIEDCRHLSARLERDLLSAGQQVVRVPPKLMAHTRASARTRGKSDPIDALAVARAVLREPDLPVASHDDVSRELNCWWIAAKTLSFNGPRRSTGCCGGSMNSIPLTRPRPASLDLAKHRDLLRAWLDTVPGLVAELARDELADITRLTEAINGLSKRIGDRVRAIAPVLLTMPGCGELTAAKLVGETAGVTRFKSEAAFARHAGVAPIPVWSGNTAGRVRLDPLGKPPAQCRPASHRHHPDPPRWPRPGLLPQTRRGRRLQHQSAALPQTPPGPKRCSTTSTPTNNNARPACQPAAA